ncbi:MAG TPA: Stp1/IreP family PP2C-type Ser/Thr phosphatase [Bryobacteraceae bacterium]|jgi:protein phosphatase|nr:Stp1/IreP family PP2C-type Ser/Thr phosphatase [Bryobacteraceae bacterium]
MKIRSDVELANLTDVGCERTANEDYYCYVEPDEEDQFLRRGRLAVVADGMGGHTGGQVASGLAVDALRDTFLDENAPVDPQAVLVAGFTRAQQAIVGEAALRPQLNGMGTTCTAVIVRGGELIYGHIGDSRLYLLRDGWLTQLTEDHTLVNHLVKSGAITSEQAAVHEKRNVLTAALGMRSDQVAADFSNEPVQLREHDVIVLASDGLHGLVSSEEIRTAVSTQAAYEACHTLVNLARQRGGPDNITVQILKILREPA